MIKTISLEEADKCVERMIEDVEAGDEYLITRDGTPVARLTPGHIGFGPLDRNPQQEP